MKKAIKVVKDICENEKALLLNDSVNTSIERWKDTYRYAYMVVDRIEQLMLEKLEGKCLKK